MDTTTLSIYERACRDFSRVTRDVYSWLKTINSQQSLLLLPENIRQKRPSKQIAKACLEKRPPWVDTIQGPRPWLYHALQSLDRSLRRDHPLPTVHQ